MFLLEVAAALKAEAVPFALVGGYAVALHGAVRGTVDIDIVVGLAEDHYTATERALQSIGLKARLPVRGAEVFQFREEYIARRNLIVWSFVDPSDPTRLVDVIITAEWEAPPAELFAVEGAQIPVLERTALIEMKRASGRPQDLSDADALEKLS